MCFIITVTHRLLTLTHKMRTIIAVLALVAVAAADVSHIASHDVSRDATIVSQDADVFPDKFRYAYETSNGISGQESGALRKSGPEDEVIAVQGSYSYTSPEGNPISVSYIADENGYQPQGAHLPTPPPPQPIPDYIIKAIEYIEAHPAKPEPGSKY